MRTDIGQRLREERKRLGLSQAALGEIGSSLASISDARNLSDTGNNENK